MKNKLLLVIVLLTSINYCYSQTKLSGVYLLNGDVSTIKNAYKVYLSYRDKEGNHATDSTLVRNGHFVFRGVIESPKEAQLMLLTKYIDKPSLKNLVGSCSVFLEPVTINLINRDTTFNPVITGSKLNREYQELDSLYQIYEKPVKAFAKAYYKERPGENAVVDSAFKKLRDSEPDGLYKPFFLSHLDSYISLYALKRYIGIHINAAKVEPLFNMLEKQYKDLPSAIELKKEIAASKTIGIGMQAPEFTQPDTSGNTVSLASYKGKYVLIDFWASWCIGCRAQNPSVVEAYEKYKDKNFTVLGISLDNNRINWLNAVKEDKLEWTQVSDLKRNNGAASLYSVLAIPENFLIDPTGKIIAKSLHGDELEKKLSEVLTR